MTAAEVQEIIDRYPLLNDCGLGYGSHKFDLAEERSNLVSEKSVAGIIAASRWISTRWARIKTINDRHTSYSLKHIYERVTGEYITNGQFIVAMLLAGFTAQMEGFNPHFAVSERSVSKTWDEGKP
jgi:hypothetical protein